ncbi:hypothetical protein [Tunturiibacter gelidiferens]|uniref:hypothetical protein n=1 Tax=Tunturiibacter gelidiferens TaxID=3069689 RepID=UPI003D9AD4AB
MPPLNDSAESSSLETFPIQKTFPLNYRDCKVLTAIMDKFEVLNGYGYPKEPLVSELAEMAGIDRDDAYYSLKRLRMARFAKS